MSVEDLTPNGKICLHRAILEAERRFFGNTTEERFKGGAVLIMNKRELAVTLIDLRTVGCPHLTQEQITDAREALRVLYVNFYLKFKNFEREQEAAAAEILRAAVSSKAAKPPTTPVHKKAKSSSPQPLDSGMSYGSGSKLEFSDSDTDEPGPSEAPIAPVKSQAQMLEEETSAANAEFKRVFKNWAKHKVEWMRLFPNADFGTFDIVNNLMDVDMGIVYLDILKTDPDRSHFGFMPHLASSSTGEIGALSAESYSERIISAANVTMTDANTRMKDDVLEMLVVLRMNREFMLFMRANYFSEIKAQQPFNLTVVRPSDDAEVEEAPPDV